jgi:hypothetical protein
MTMRSSAVVLGVSVLLTLTASAPGLFAEEDQKQVTITGEIEAVDYDEQDMPTAVSVFDAEWGEVLIAHTGKGKELLKQVGALVELTGRIEELADNGDFVYQLTVQSYTILEQAPDSSYEEPDPDR